MSRFVVGNVFLVLSMLCGAGSQILIKGVLDEVRWGDLDLSWRTFQMFLAEGWLLRGGAGAVLLVAGFVFWILCLVRLDLSYAYPIGCSSVLLVALFSGLFLGEMVTLRVWSGTFLILIGIILVVPTK